MSKENKDNTENVCEKWDGKYTCEDLYNCCDCGIIDGDGCGCAYCWSCNACEVCLSE